MNNVLDVGRGMMVSLRQNLTRGEESLSGLHRYLAHRGLHGEQVKHWLRLLGSSQRTARDLLGAVEVTGYVRNAKIELGRYQTFLAALDRVLDLVVDTQCTCTAAPTEDDGVWMPCPRCQIVDICARVAEVSQKGGEDA